MKIAYRVMMLFTALFSSYAAVIAFVDAAMFPAIIWTGAAAIWLLLFILEVTDNA